MAANTSLPSTLLPRALLLGGTGRFPFNGHARFVVEAQHAQLHVAARLAASCEPPQAWEAARALGRGLLNLTGSDRHQLLREAWQVLAVMEFDSFSPCGDQDLALLLVAVDARGMGLTGTGLAAVYEYDGSEGRPLVPPAHPLLALEGVPKEPPGVLTLHEEPRSVIAAARGGAMDPGSLLWPLACGWREARE